MGSASTDFLEKMGRQGYLPQLEELKGTLRLDLIDGQETDSWLIVVEDGNVRVARGRQDADCVIHAERVFFDRVAIGEANALSALLRGLIQIEGDLHLALAVGRALPGPPHSRWRGHRSTQPVRGRQQ